jgi:NTE family protein
MGIGLVLTGGGGKGAYQIGVWKALIELGLEKRISAVSGVSVGALNTALFINGDYSLAENIWYNISADSILMFNGKNLMLGQTELEINTADLNYLMEKINSNNAMLASKNLVSWPNITSGIFSKKGLTDIINTHLDLNKISTSKIFAAVNCTLMPWVLPKYFVLNTLEASKIQSILLASSAFPIAFGFENIEGYSYIDGGVTDNSPITPLYKHGYKTIIVVNLGQKPVVDASKYPNSHIIEIIPSKDLGKLLTGTFDFDSAHAKSRIELGYLDGLKLKDMDLD